jgi:hypothetical protein
MQAGGAGLLLTGMALANNSDGRGNECRFNN